MSNKHPNKEIQKARDVFNKKLLGEKYQKIYNNSKKIKKFLEYKIQNEKTRRVYNRHYKIYFFLTETKNIDDYIKDMGRLENGEKADYRDRLEDDILKYNKFISEKLSFEGKSTSQGISSLQSLFEQRVPIFTKKFWHDIRRNGKGTYAVTDTKTPDREMLKEIFSKGKDEEKALFGIQKDTGSRINRILNLEWEDIQDLENDNPQIRFYRTKTKRPIKCFITVETKDAIIRYKKDLKEILRLRKIRAKNTKFTGNVVIDTKKVFPMSSGDARVKWVNMVKRAGYYSLDKKTGKPVYGSHCLRRYFLDNFNNEKLGRFFSGKMVENEETYNRKSDKELRELYIKYSKNLILYSVVDSSEIKELRQKVELLEKTVISYMSGEQFRPDAPNFELTQNVINELIKLGKITIVEDEK